MIKTIETDIDVLTAARQRIINLFSNGAKVYMSMSGGKDSITMADITYNLIKEGLIDKSLLTVIFIDEECMYDDVIEIVKQWRKKFLLIGVAFEWYCLEVKHFNCINQLEDEETFIVYDRYAKENWIQQPPPFAIMSHPLCNPRAENYQTFLKRRTEDGFQMVGVRVAESFQRRGFIATSMKKLDSVSAGRQLFPIYDWQDDDVWYYLYKNKVDIPVTYLRMWQVGVHKSHLRICNFFAIDTMKCLVRMSQFDPNLMDRVERRQPNSYLAAMYFDTAFFGRRTAARKQAEKKLGIKKDYRKECLDYLYNDSNFTTENRKKTQRNYKNAIRRFIGFNPSNKRWQRLYEGLVAGDTKGRTLRAVEMHIKMDYENNALNKTQKH